MKIVIDVDENMYNKILNSDWNATLGGFALCHIASGTVLPKGHGRLIDADDLIQDIINDSQLYIFNSECERIVHDEMVNFAIDRLADASTIIEADKGEERWKKY